MIRQLDLLQTFTILCFATFHSVVNYEKVLLKCERSVFPLRCAGLQFYNPVLNGFVRSVQLLSQLGNPDRL